MTRTTPPKEDFDELGGIYGLERLMHNSPADQHTVIDVLAAYLRDTSKKLPKPTPITSPRLGEWRPTPPSTELQAALTVLGRQPQANYWKPDLSGASLSGANLIGVDMTGANLRGANLSGADLRDTDVGGADVGGAILSGAILRGEHLRDAILIDADLSSADLIGANLRGANLIGADLIGANLSRADLRGADRGLSTTERSVALAKSIVISSVRMWGAEAHRLGDAPSIFPLYLGSHYIERMASRVMTEPAFFILTSLLDEPRHGYGIVTAVQALSDGRVELKIGSLYGVLDRLTGDGLLEVDREEAWSGRLRRYYKLTEPGRAALALEAERLASNAQLATTRLRARTPGLGPVGS